MTSCRTTLVWYSWFGGETLDWLRPDDDWPSHDKAAVRKALDQARAAGFLLHPHSSHAYGTLRCSGGHPTNAVHEINVLHSGKGDKAGTTTASLILSKVRQCKRARAGQDVDLALDADQILDIAHRCAISARTLAKSEVYEAKGVEALESAVASESDGDLAEALEYEDRHRRASDEARREVERYGLSEPWPPGDGAAELARVAREFLSKLGEAAGLDAEQQARWLEIRQALDDPW